MKKFTFLYYQESLIGIKGRIQTRKVEDEEKTNYYTDIIGERVTFLSSTKKPETIEEE